MAHTVFLLGAGASKAAGAPLMNEFLVAIRDTYESGIVSHLASQFELVLRGYEQLQLVHSKVRLDYEANIEDLLASFEMARILGYLGTLSEKDIDSLPQAMRRVISATLDYSMPFYPDSELGLKAHDVFFNFGGILKKLRTNEQPDFSVITFNYDVGLDYELVSRGDKIDYGLDQEKDKEAITFLKLHGSLNWSTCNQCKSIVPYDLRKFKEKFGVSTTGRAQQLGISDVLTDMEHCETRLAPDPFIVPPTWNKMEYQSRIAEVWRKASVELSEARNLVLIGYSIPATDEFFRHMLALSLSRGLFLDKIIVVNIDAEAKRRLEKMLAENLKGKIKPITRAFEDSMTRLEEELGIR